MKPRVEFVTWECGDQPDAKELTDLARKGFVFFRYVDADSGMNVMTASKTRLSKEEAQTAWDKELAAYCT